MQRVLAGLLALPTSAPLWAMRQCPPESMPRPLWFDAVGWGVAVSGVLLGALVPLLVWRRTRGRRARARAALVAAALLVMLAIWCAGLLVWLGAFVLPC
ncbi:MULTISPECIES: hypothetical protein [Luteimonas]|uniref:hypothetical protein n=1 Tax=Luteimonas TaxID=83614 RepID=UPI0011811BCB|nr:MULTISPECIES: hypothetical protein [Luteimonas]